MVALNILNVVIGLIFTWTIFSMAAMYIQEWIASVRKWRSRMLEITIGNILTDPALLCQLYNHPVVQSLYTGANGGNAPSYIPSGQFAQALLDIISTAGTEASLLQQQLYRIQHDVLSRKKGKKRQAQQQLGLILAMIRRVLVDKSDTEAANSILNSIDLEMQAFGNEYTWARPAINKALSTVSALKKEVDSQLKSSKNGQTLPTDSIGRKILDGSIALGVTHPRLKQTLDALLLGVPEMAWESEMGLEHIRTIIEEWYNNAMARLTGWYKRRTQLVTLLLGLMMAMFLNVDSLNVASNLWNQPYRAESIVSEAESLLNAQQDAELADTGQTGLSYLKQMLGNIQLPIGWLSVLGSLTNQIERSGQNEECVLSPIGEGDIYGFQIGSQCYPFTNTPLPSDTTGWILKGIGLLITGLAIGQGAPFWFDILKKIINIRFTGLNPAEGVKSFG